MKTEDWGHLFVCAWFVKCGHRSRVYKWSITWVTNPNSVCSHTQTHDNINDVPAAPAAHLPLFADGTCVYTTEKHERRVLCKLQRGLTAVNSWCECWNIKINGGKTQKTWRPWRRTITKRTRYFLCKQCNLFLCHFCRRMTWRHHIERTFARALRSDISTYSLFRSGRLSTNVRLTLYKVVIRWVMTYACATWKYVADALLLKLQRLQISVPRCWKSWQVHTSPRIAGGFQNSLHIWLCN
jgi:hypothetical protein